jgi:hypothetical protein
MLITKDLLGKVNLRENEEKRKVRQERLGN